MINTANFFWHGQFSIYEYACISSFAKNNFKVQVFAFDDTMEIPPGIILRDARDILPEELLYSYTLSGQKGSMAGFADAFRCHLIKKEGGWWFDADIICLKDVSVFIDSVRVKPKALSMGFQNSKYITNAVIYAEDSQFVDALLLQLEKTGNVAVWGETGPRLITTVINNLGYKDYVDPVEKYFPVDGVDLMKLFDPENKEWCYSKISDSSALHIWNDGIKHVCIPKNMLPPDGSFLKEIFIRYCPELAHLPTLPADTARRLFEFNSLKCEHDRMKRTTFDRITGIADKIRNNANRLINNRRKM